MPDAARTEASRHGSAPVRALVVDDSAADRFLVSAMLNRSETPIDIVEAADLQRAVDLLVGDRFDCVLLDLQLPDAQGLTGLVQVRATAPDTAVIVLTGTDSSALGQRAVAAGAQDYLDKGRFDVETLLRAVRYSVERQRIQSGLAAATQALSTSEERFRRAFEDAPVGMALSTYDLIGHHRVIEANQSLGDILGCRPDALLGRPLEERLHPESRVADGAALLQLLEHVDGSQTVETRLMRVDGTPTWVKLTGSLIRDSDGHPLQSLIQVEDINERRKAQEQLSEYSFFDVLTQLPNRLLALDRIRLALARGARTGRSVAVLYLDIDHFKVINDSLGHGAGDELLRVVGARLPQAVRPEDTVARIGGDEFIICCDDLPAEPGAAELEAVDIAERVRSHLERSVNVDGRDLSVTVSIGIAVSSDKRRSADELMRDADTALYRAKDNGRSRWEVFDEALRAEAVNRLETERALRRALDKVELAVVYQPLVEMATGRVVGAEALLRWQHPSAGLTTPSEFIRVAEETGLIVPIGRWVLEQACQTLATWRRTQRGVSIAVNVSAKQLLRSDLAATVSDLCDQYDLKPGDLTLEVTERQLVDLVGSGLAELRSLAELGVQIALDDFGTGYGSLTYLRTLPVHTVKIDQSFVYGMKTSPTDLAIVQSVLGLGKAMGLNVIAEGVETRELADALGDLGCPLGQGWLYGRPVPPEELIAGRRL